MICRACKTDNPAGNRFCGSCGAALDPPERDSAKPAAETEQENAERRRLVVLFADVVSSTEIASHLDPEEWHELLSDYQAVVSDAVASLGGRVAKYLGDGVLAYFGWPIGHENDSERAALAGRAILDGIARLNQRSTLQRRPMIAARIGIHVGEVVVDASGEVYGDAPNIAARVQAEADVDSVVVTEAVFPSIAGRLATEILKDRLLRGVDRPMRLYRVLSAARMPAAPTRLETPFIGRSAELRAILQAWDIACGGAARVVTVAGEAGIGKSRLIREFHARIAGTPHLWLEASGSDVFRNTPFHPVVQLLNRLVGFRDPDQTTRTRRLSRLLQAAGLDVAESLPLLTELVTGETAKSASAAARTPAERRALWLKLLVEWTIQSARRRPTVLVVEDLHWVDPSTLEVLEALVEAPDTSLLVVLTARPEFRASWPVHSHHSHIVLGRLGRSDIREIVKGAAAAPALLEYVVDSIADRTSGIPLFAEELARLVEGRGNGGDSKAIPDTLAASLTARLDQLGPAREIAQIGAVIGDEFDPALLAVVSNRAPDALAPLLDRMAETGILASRAATAGRVLAFRHSLLRDAAYASLLRSRRRQLHERVADAIAADFPALAREHPEVMARHLSLANRPARSIAAWRQAGVGAAERGAYREAENAFREALSEIEKLPESRERDAQHLDIRNALVGILQVTQGYSAPKTTEAAAPARELSERIGEAEQSLAQAAASWAALSSAGNYAAASQIADRFLDLARRDGRSRALAGAHMMQMTSHYRLGDLVEAEHYFLAGEALFADEDFRRLPGAIAQTFGNAGRNVWMLGRPDEARRRMAHAIDSLAASDRLYDIAFADYMGAILAVLMRDEAKARRLAEKSIDLSDKNGFPQFAAISRIALGRALVDTDRSSESVDLIERGVAGMAVTGSRVALTLYLAWLAEAQSAAGDLYAALGSIDRAFSLNPEELFFRPELLRIRGELLFATADRDRAEADVREAIVVAGDMRALGLQLRAAMGLHRILSHAGGPGASETVAAVYGQFTEGFDTPDLVEASAISSRRA